MFNPICLHLFNYVNSSHQQYDDKIFNEDINFIEQSYCIQNTTDNYLLQNFYHWDIFQHFLPSESNLFLSNEISQELRPSLIFPSKINEENSLQNNQLEISNSNIIYGFIHNENNGFTDFNPIANDDLSSFGLNSCLSNAADKFASKNSHCYLDSLGQTMNDIKLLEKGNTSINHSPELENRKDIISNDFPKYISNTVESEINTATFDDNIKLKEKREGKKLLICGLCNKQSYTKLFIKPGSKIKICRNCYLDTSNKEAGRCCKCNIEKTSIWFNATNKNNKICHECKFSNNRNNPFNCNTCNKTKVGKRYRTSIESNDKLCGVCYVKRQKEKDFKCTACNKIKKGSRRIDKTINKMICMKCYIDKKKKSQDTFFCINCQKNKTGFKFKGKTKAERICYACYYKIKIIKEFSCEHCHKIKKAKIYKDQETHKVMCYNCYYKSKIKQNLLAKCVKTI